MDNENMNKKVIILIVKTLLYLIIDCGLMILFYNYLIKKSNNLFFFFLVIFILTVVGIFSWCGMQLGKIRANIKILKDDNDIKKNNPYIYFRELPNNFGIGVASLLMDSTLENYKDIVAIILDLCARKYLHLTKENDKYVVKVLKGIDDKLLFNEKYIMELILDNNIKNIDYQLWFNYCLNDGSKIDLYHSPKNIKKVNNKKKFNFFEIITISILEILVFIFSVSSFIKHNGLVGGILEEIFCLVVCYFIIRGILFIIKLFILPVKTFMINNQAEYQNIMKNQLVRTDKGVDEMRKLLAFRDFLADFGHFVDKRAEEVVLWDRYLSYANLFGLTKELIKSGYSQLVDNSSFKIDEFDHIRLDNIVYK